MNHINELHEAFSDKLFKIKDNCDYKVVNKYLLKFLQGGKYVITDEYENDIYISIRNNNSETLSLVVNFEYFEADGSNDTDYFNGTGEFIEETPARVNINEVEFYSNDGDPLKWQTTVAVDEELEAIILNLKQ